MDFLQAHIVVREIINPRSQSRLVPRQRIIDSKGIAKERIIKSWKSLNHSTLYNPQNRFGEARCPSPISRCKMKAAHSYQRQPLKQEMTIILLKINNP